MTKHRHQNDTPAADRLTSHLLAAVPWFVFLMGLLWGCGATDQAWAAPPPPAGLTAPPPPASLAAIPVTSRGSRTADWPSGATAHRHPPSTPHTTMAAMIAAVKAGADSLAAEVQTLLSLADSLPVYAVVVVPVERSLSPYAKSLSVWSLIAFAWLATWAISKRASPARRTAAPVREPVGTFGDAAPPAPLHPAPAAAPTRPAQAQGADLAARARFVAMNFAIPEVITSLQGSSLQGSSRWPLRLRCRPTRFTLTLQHAALRYRLQFFNSGAEALGPLIVRADLAAVQVRVPQDRQADFDGEALPLCHYLDGLEAGANVELTGELRLPLTSVAAMRLGGAELLVPLMRLCVASIRDVQPILSVSNCFAIGIPPVAANSGIQPFRLDLAPQIWRELAARQLVCAKAA